MQELSVFSLFIRIKLKKRATIYVNLLLITYTKKVFLLKQIDFRPLKMIYFT
jgi:hypothetical protein